MNWGKVEGKKAVIYLKEDSVPIYCKARPVPLALKNKVEVELDRLEREGIIEKVGTLRLGCPDGTCFET